jgi:hypothetical protein
MSANLIDFLHGLGERKICEFALNVPSERHLAILQWNQGA